MRAFGHYVKLRERLLLQLNRAPRTIEGTPQACQPGVFPENGDPQTLPESGPSICAERVKESRVESKPPAFSLPEIRLEPVYPKNLFARCLLRLFFRLRENKFQNARNAAKTPKTGPKKRAKILRITGIMLTMALHRRRCMSSHRCVAGKMALYCCLQHNQGGSA